MVDLQFNADVSEKQGGFETNVYRATLLFALRTLQQSKWQNNSSTANQSNPDISGIMIVWLRNSEATPISILKILGREQGGRVARFQASPKSGSSIFPIAEGCLVCINIRNMPMSI